MSEKKQPAFHAFTVRKVKDGKKAQWVEIGAAWLHKDAKGFDIVLDALPCDGRVVLRLNVPKAKADE